jgi:lipid-A-disaccharide synthase
VTGLVEVVRGLASFRRLLRRLVDLACARQPDVIVLVDFQAFNRRLARVLRDRIVRQRGRFQNWDPRIVQYVSPQVWASRPGRAHRVARDVDLLLCLFPFEQEWYARQVPRLRVVAVGHPILDRHPEAASERVEIRTPPTVPRVLLLPGSRAGELKRHLPPMLGACRILASQRRVEFRMVLPDDSLRRTAATAVAATGLPVDVAVGGLGPALAGASVAMASTGTVTLECAAYGVPTVALYVASPVTYWIGRQLVTVKYLAMPNLLAGAEVMPEFLQGAATPANLARAALGFLNDPALAAENRSRLRGLLGRLGSPGGSRRAAAAILSLLGTRSPVPLQVVES